MSQQEIDDLRKKLKERTAERDHFIRELNQQIEKNEKLEAQIARMKKAKAVK